MLSASTISLSQALAFLATSFVVYYIISAIHCIFFHPLSRYPGPLLAKFSGLPSFYHVCKGNRHIWLWQLHQKYGEAVRASYDTVLFSNPETYREIYGTGANVQKAWQFGIWPKDAHAVSTFASQDKSVHKRRRRNLEYAFTDRAVRGAEKFVAEHVERWGPILAGDDEGTKEAEEWSEARNMTDWANSYVFDILCDLCFGWTYETKKPGPNKLRTVPNDVAEYMAFTYKIFYSPFMTIWMALKRQGIDNLLAGMASPSVKFFMDFVGQSLSERLEKARINEKSGKAISDREDMLHYLISAREEGSEKPAYDIVDLTEEANMLTAAGADTTSAVIAAMFFYLINNPEPLKKLQDEIRTTFASADEITYGKTTVSCPYLTASIDESLRMNPHGGSESRRQIMKGGIRIGDHYIPEGSIIGGDVYTIQHDPNLFPQPFQYKPERWIAGNGVSAEEVQARQGALFPFSYGTRACPGKGLARMELAVTMARLIWEYDFKGEPGSTEGQGGPDMMWGRQDKTQFQVWDYMVAHRDGPMVQFKKRVV